MFFLVSKRILCLSSQSGAVKLGGLAHVPVVSIEDLSACGCPTEDPYLSRTQWGLRASEHRVWGGGGTGLPFSTMAAASALLHLTSTSTGHSPEVSVRGVGMGVGLPEEVRELSKGNIESAVWGPMPGVLTDCHTGPLTSQGPPLVFSGSKSRAHDPMINHLGNPRMVAVPALNGLLWGEKGG